MWLGQEGVASHRSSNEYCQDDFLFHKQDKPVWPENILQIEPEYLIESLERYGSHGVCNNIISGIYTQSYIICSANVQALDDLGTRTNIFL